MSALRLSRPGYATELRVLDDGASPYRRGYAIGGSLVTERVPPPRSPVVGPTRLAQMAAYKARMRLARAVCGVPSRGIVCARRPGHQDQHQSREAMDRMLVRRRTP